MLALTACKDNSDKKEEITFDSLSSDINNKTDVTNDSTSYVTLDKTLKNFTNKYKAVINWSDYYKGNETLVRRDLKNKNLIFPVFKEQIKYLLQSGLTDTILVYMCDKSNAFVINITKGEDTFKKLNVDNNGIILVRADDISYSQKLYLMKKHNEFQHKEYKVTEFYIKAELIDANNINIKDELLEEKFKLEK